MYLLPAPSSNPHPPNILDFALSALVNYISPRMLDDKIKKVVAQFLKEIEEPMRTFATSFCLPTWEAPSTSEEYVSSHINSLDILKTEVDSLLLHKVGDLCRYWGFYFPRCQQRDSNYRIHKRFHL